jgi:hypothetical protein
MRAAGRTFGVHSASWLGVVRSAAVLPMHERPLQPARRRVVRGSSRCRRLTVTGWATLFICKGIFYFLLIDVAPPGGRAKGLVWDRDVRQSTRPVGIMLFATRRLELAA